MILGFAAGIIVVLAALFYIGATDEPDKKPPMSQTPAVKPAAPPAAPAPQVAVKEYLGFQEDTP